MVGLSMTKGAQRKRRQRATKAGHLASQASNQKYRSSPKGKAKVQKGVQKYKASPKGKATAQRSSQKYAGSPKGKAKVQKYAASAKGKAKVQRQEQKRTEKRRQQRAASDLEPLQRPLSALALAEREVLQRPQALALNDTIQQQGGVCIVVCGTNKRMAVPSDEGAGFSSSVGSELIDGLTGFGRTSFAMYKSKGIKFSLDEINAFRRLLKYLWVLRFEKEGSFPSFPHGQRRQAHSAESGVFMEGLSRHGPGDPKRTILNVGDVPGINTNKESKVCAVCLTPDFMVAVNPLFFLNSRPGGKRDTWWRYNVDKRELELA